MSSRLYTAPTHPEASERERSSSGLPADLDLSALEQQFFVEWAVLESHEPQDGALTR